MKFLNPLMRQYLRARMPRIQRMMQQPVDRSAAGVAALDQSSSRNTRWGAQFHYHSIRKRSPIFKTGFRCRTTTRCNPIFSKCCKGEQNVLWPSRIQWFSKSSGTTHHSSKLIPVSKEAIYDSHVKTGKDLMAIHYHRFPGSKVFAGKSMLIGGSLQRAAGNSQHSGGRCIGCAHSSIARVAAVLSRACTQHCAHAGLGKEDGCHCKNRC
jgi:hypothetical protein